MAINNRSPGVNFSCRHINRYFILTNHLRFDGEFCEGNDRVATHRAVTLVVQKKDVEVGIGR